MFYMVIYDVPSDKIRPKLADICLDHGLERIQYSAFLGEMELAYKQALLNKLRRKLGDYSPAINCGASTDFIPMRCSPSARMLSAALWSRSSTRLQSGQVYTRSSSGIAWR